ncbi:hypothetical protein PHLGIDRAFT_401810 [Phlebiopsis gigantea 11061_1 CR5-6]|uniref:DUF6533 domain-containing protein n=1 Tax=Phlebiopsis gigantea (strain 11061_1 CR5-6) TaxID=745531 RepID=A0A0C3NS07_PHLG1|nr:hypothetical protein PHLGIDRAFT_401810 [Phlebiopsis gigantea 11061_1 CR5-6]
MYTRPTLLRTNRHGTWTRAGCGLPVNSDYLLTAVTALNIYEYAITFQQELEAIQNTKFTATSWLLIFTRYTTVLGPLANYLRYSEISCQVYKLVSLAIASLVNIQTAGFSALRAYALTNRNMYVFSLVVVLGGLIPLAMSVTASATQRSPGIFSDALHSNQLGPCDPTIPLTGTKILYIHLFSVRGWSRSIGAIYHVE